MFHREMEVLFQSTESQTFSGLHHGFAPSRECYTDQPGDWKGVEAKWGLGLLLAAERLDSLAQAWSALGPHPCKLLFVL